LFATGDNRVKQTHEKVAHTKYNLHDNASILTLLARLYFAILVYA